MFKFNTGYRKDFKSEEAFLSDVYNRNITRLPVGTNKEMFIAQVQSYKVAYDTNVTGALRKLANTEDYTPYVERAHDNVLKTLENFGKLKKFKTMIRDEKGHFVKYDRSLLKWNRDGKYYVYDGKVIIDIRNSPEDVIIRYA